MKTFDRDGKYNFVDDNNVFVGFDSYPCCCEQFGWSLRTSVPTTFEEAREDTWHLPTDGFQFDTQFFQEPGIETGDCGGVVVFRLTNPEGTEIFLSLYNCHNGYYSHGFEATVGGANWQGGSL